MADAIDLSKLSDDELRALSSQNAPLSGMPDKDLQAAYWGGQGNDLGGDIAKSFASGAATHGVPSVAGLPGDLKWLVGKGMDWVGAPPADPRAPDINPPTSKAVQSQVEKVVPPYEAKTIPGQVAGTVGSFAPGALLAPESAAGRVPGMASAFARYALAPGMASEAVTAIPGVKGGPLEQPARVAAALATPGVAGKAITPNQITPERAAYVNTLRREGVHLSPEQMAGKDIDPALGQFTNAAMRRAGETRPNVRATPDVMDHNFSRVGGTFDRVGSRNNLEGDNQLGHEFVDTEHNYLASVPPNMVNPTISNTIREVGSAIANNHGVLPGETYQALRSRLARAARESSDPQYSHALSNLTESLDDAMERSIGRNNPADAGVFGNARREYRNLLVLDRAARAAGPNAAMGYLSPDAVAGAAKQVHGGRAWTRGQGDFNELARAGVATGVGKVPPSPVEQSFTSKLKAELPLAVMLGIEGHHMGGIPGMIAGMATSVAGPAALSAAKNSAAGQRYLGNQVIPRVPVGQDLAKQQLWATQADQALIRALNAGNANSSP